MPIQSNSRCASPASPSLRGSGLKCQSSAGGGVLHRVSLFTREWIEIVADAIFTDGFGVSLFTREWIEIAIIFCKMSFVHVSPSLRGSGLKCL